MSSVIDERIVSMAFDNRRFESNVKDTIASLGNLKEALKLGGVSDAIEKTSTGILGLGSDIVSLTAKLTVVSNITSQLTGAAERLVKSLTIDQVSAGWEKFGNKTSSVSTLVAQGYALETVNEQLDRLNWFTDETSYNFTDMVSNIAKFTATGQDLETSVTAMEGIANWAALSGQNASTASRAMYQLSQAMGAGVMRLEDYKSIQNVSMDTDEFRQKALDAAVALGTLKKNADGTYQSLVNDQGSFEKSQFANHLTQDAWFTKDVMMEVFTSYSAAVDQIYEYADEKGITASEAIEELGDQVDEFGLKAFKAAQQARTWGDVIDSVKDAVSTGWMNTFEIIFGNADEATELWTDLANAMWDVFASSGEVRNEILKGWKELGGRNDLIEAFWNTWDAVASVVAPVKEAFTDIFPPVTAELLADLTKKLKEFTAGLKLSEETAGKVKNVFHGIFSVANLLISVIKTLASWIINIASRFKGLTGIVLDAAEAIGKWFSALNESAKNNDIFAKALAKAGEAADFLEGQLRRLKAAVEAKIADTQYGTIGHILSVLAVGARNAVKIFMELGKKIVGVINTDNIKSVVSIINGGILFNVFKVMKETLEPFSEIAEGISGILNGVKGTLKAWQSELKAKTLLAIAEAVGILAASLFIIALIDEDKLVSSLAGIAGLFAELAVVSKMSSSFSGSFNTLSLIGLATAVLVLSSALKVISTIDTDELVKSLIALGVLCAELALVLKSMSSIGLTAITGTTGIIALSVGIVILSAACKIFAKMSWEDIAKGLVTIGALLTEISIFLNTAKLGVKSVLGAVGLTIFAGALKILAWSISDFASIDLSSVMTAVTAIGALLLEFSLFSYILNPFTSVLSGGALILFAIGLDSIIDVVARMVAMDTDKVTSNVNNISTLMSVLAVVMRVLPKKTAIKSVSLIIMAKAISVLMDAVMSVGSGSLVTAAKGVAVVSASLIIFSLCLKKLEKTTGAAISLLILSVALGAITNNIKVLSGLSIQGVGIALLAMAGAIGVLALSAVLLKPLVGTIVKLSGAFALFGLGATLLGAGLLSISAGFTALVTTIILTFDQLIEFIPKLVSSLQGILHDLVALVEIGVQIICEALTDMAPMLLKTILSLIDSLKDYTPAIVDSLLDFLVILLEKLETRIPEVVEKAADVLKTFFNSLNKALSPTDGMGQLISSLTFVAVGFLAIVTAIKLISTIKIGDVVKGIAGFAIIVTGLVGLLALLGEIQQIPEIGWLVSEGTKLFAQVGNAIGVFVGKLVTGLVNSMPADIDKVLLALSSLELMALAFAPLVKVFGNMELKSIGMALVGASAGIALILGWLLNFGLIASDPTVKGFLESSTDITTAIGKAIGGFIGGIVEGLSSVVSVDIQQIATSLMGIVGAVGALKVVFSIVGSLKGSVSAANAVQASLGAAAVVGIVGAVLTILGLLTKIEGFEETVESGIGVLSKIGLGLGEFIGSLISGIGVGFSDSLVAIGNNLSAFMTAVGPFVDGLGSISTDILAGAASLTGAILAITTANLFEDFLAAPFLGKMSLAGFGEQIAELGVFLVDFAETTKDLDTESVRNAAEAGKLLVDMAAAIPNENGLVNLFTGDNTLEKFTQDIAKFVIGLRNFGYEAKGIDVDSIKTAVEAGRALTALTESIPRSNGVEQWFTGEHSISKFGSELAGLGIGLRNFAQETTGIDVSGIPGVVEAAKGLTELAESVPSSKGVVQWFMGEKNISQFGDDLTNLAKGIRGFAYNASNIKPDSVKNATEAGKYIAEMTETIPNSDGVIQFFTGDKNISKFGSELAGLGTGLKNFSQNTAGLKKENVEAAAQAATAVAVMTQTIPAANGVAQWFTGSISINDFGDQLGALGKGIKAFAEQTVGIKSDGVQAAAIAGSVIAEMTQSIPSGGSIFEWFTGSQDIGIFAQNLASLGTGLKNFAINSEGINIVEVQKTASAASKVFKMISDVPKTDAIAGYSYTLSDISDYTIAFSDVMHDVDITGASDKIEEILELSKSISSADLAGLNGFANTMQRTAEKGVNNFRETFTHDDTKRSMRASVGKMFERIGEDVVSNVEILGAKFRELFINAAVSLSENISMFETVGRNITLGLSRGISEKTEEVRKAAGKVAGEAAEAARNELDIQSPSRVFRAIGEYAGLGFVNGLNYYADISSKAGTELGDSAKNGINSAIGKITDIVNGDIDYQPTITPVLDLSEISDGIGKLDALMSRKTAVGIAADISRPRDTVDGTSASGTTTSTNLVFNQNITAPKALDSKTIYRQTRNQFSRMREVFGT